MPKENAMYSVKSIPVNIKDLSVSDRTVTGYFAAFGSVDYDEDIFEPGAFDKTLAEWGPEGRNKIVHLYQHDTRMPLAKPKVLKADDYGVYFESQFATTSFGNDALKLYEAGVINEHSVGFQILRSDPTTREGKTFQAIKEVRMWEGSTVTFGANENTPFMGMKSLDKVQLTERIDKLTKAVRNGTFTDETFHLLEIQLVQLGALVKEHLPDNGSPVEQTTTAEVAPDDIAKAIDKFILTNTTQWKI
jgi:HK97 family phage prohead protease